MKKSSPYKGIHFDKNAGWMTSIKRGDKRVTRGPFKYEAWAIEARRILGGIEDLDLAPTTAELREIVKSADVGDDQGTVGLREMQREKGVKPYVLET